MTTTEALKMWKKIELNSLYGLPRTPEFFYLHHPFDDDFRPKKSLISRYGSATINDMSQYVPIKVGKVNRIVSENDPYGEENWEE